MTISLHLCITCVEHVLCRDQSHHSPRPTELTVQSGRQRLINLSKKHKATHAVEVPQGLAACHQAVSAD